ncbi:Guanylate kinase/L-type calcium channel beta subunit [Kalmanozyma brasiliensis GHG001]|uniref:Guanylate kinase n=1 Tax=Kalmanozyma brasiliensis (strain GHG001) TaxID=1365824 RepID=V5EJY4_KALBG|nr:Guanylate kinase/L-type calcium channel beta subunit [Kalmanozyma brasiliensis GHG001]EST05145.1 Guanylate kinase/L-type calcium channel beta subunit [Kalmanozyma brasiliensis GHG001]
MSTSNWASTPPIPSDKRPIVLSGPSGVGKSTLLKKLFAEFPGDFGFSVSHTTRDPRPGETRGQSYHYVSHAEFEDLIAAGAFLEHAQFGGNRYGTTAKAVADVSTEGVSGADGSTNARRAVLDIDAQGVKLIKQNHPSLNPIYIFIGPPSFGVLKQRLTGRGTETDESVRKRLNMAHGEMKFAREGGHDWVVINDDLERAYGVLKRAIDGTLKKGEDDKMPDMDEEEKEWEKSQQ